MDKMTENREYLKNEYWLNDKEFDIVTVDHICNNCWNNDCHGICSCCAIIIQELRDLWKDNIKGILESNK